MTSEPAPPIHGEILTVSIVIPTRDRATSLAITLNALHCLLVPDEIALQIVIVMDGCTDNSVDIFSQWQSQFQHSAIAVHTDGLGAAGARNVGLTHASGDLIGFIDDDVIPESSWLTVHLGCHQYSSEPLVSIGAMTLPQDVRLPPWNEWEVQSLRRRYHELESGAQAEPTDLYTANAMMPRDALEQVGGFDESLRRAEDVDLGIRLADAGLKFTFLTDASVAHYPIRTLRNWKKIPIAYAESHFEMQTDGDDVTQLGSPQLSNMHPITVIAVRIFARSKITSNIYCAIAQAFGYLAYAVRLRSISYAAFSSVYNVLYFGTLYRIQAQHVTHKFPDNA